MLIVLARKPLLDTGVGVNKLSRQKLTTKRKLMSADFKNYFKLRGEHVTLKLLYGNTYIFHKVSR